MIKTALLILRESRQGKTHPSELFETSEDPDQPMSSNKHLGQDFHNSSSSITHTLEIYGERYGQKIKLSK